MRELSRISPQLKLKVSKRARRMALRLDVRTRTINLVIPPRANLMKAVDFAKQHSTWIRENLANLPEPRPFVHGQVIPVFGIPRKIKITYRPTFKTTEIELRKNEIIVRTNKEDPSARITRFLKEKAREKISQMAVEKAALTGKRIKSVHIRDTKSRWGSCAHDRALSFSWRLIFAPFSAMDYVVAHEVAHLVHMNHGPRFWELCEELSLYYNAGKTWMKAYGHTLLSYGAGSEEE